MGFLSDTLEELREFDLAAALAIDRSRPCVSPHRVWAPVACLRASMPDGSRPCSARALDQLLEADPEGMRRMMGLAWAQRPR